MISKYNNGKKRTLKFDKKETESSSTHLPQVFHWLLLVFYVEYLRQNCANTSGPSVIDAHISNCVKVSCKECNENIETFGKEKYAWKVGSVQNIMNIIDFQYDVLCQSCLNTPNIHTTCLVQQSW